MNRTEPTEALTILRPALFERHPEVVAAMSTRNGGASPAPFGMNLSYLVGDDRACVRANRERFFAMAGIPLSDLAIPGQVHSCTIQVVDAPGDYPRRDALVTNTPGVYLCVTVADCVPILLFEPVTRVVAAVHAGWRGTVGRIVTSAVGVMRDAFGARPAEILAYLGPAADTCCYIVGDDVAAQFDSRFTSRDARGTIVDLKSANRDLLLQAGVVPENIEVSPACTISNAANFHSYRRDRERSGRMMAVLGLRGHLSIR